MKIGDHVIIYWSCSDDFTGKICKVRKIKNKRFYCEEGIEFAFNNEENDGSKYIKLSPAMKILFGVS